LLGLDNTGVMLAYLLSVAGSILCVIYGIAKWNSTE